MEACFFLSWVYPTLGKMKDGVVTNFLLKSAFQEPVLIVPGFQKIYDYIISNKQVYCYLD